MVLQVDRLRDMGQMQADRTSVDGHVGQRGKVGSKRPVSTLNANNRFVMLPVVSQIFICTKKSWIFHLFSLKCQR